MDEPEQARAYAAADFAEANQRFVDRALPVLASLAEGSIVLDLGCGPADIPIRLARVLPRATFVGVDASPVMLELAHEAVSAAGLGDRITLRQGQLPGLDLAQGTASAIVSNSLLHHLPDPAALWAEVRRLGRPGAPVVVGDLFRPASEDAARAIVKAAAVSDHPLLERDFLASLLAAFTLDEVRAQLRAAGLQRALVAEVVSERHLLVRGRLPL
jgi:ubiquinone/menaquinone biosynthesis C-methylase UbiE